MKTKTVRGLCPVCGKVVEVDVRQEKWDCPGGHTVETWKDDGEIPF